MLTAEKIIADATSSFFSSDLVLGCGAALLTSSVILAFAYVWAVLWRNEQLKGSVKLELNEVIISAIMVSFILALIGSLNEIKISTVVPQNLTPSDTPRDATVYNITESYFLKVKDDLLGFIDINYKTSVPVDLLASANPHTRPFGVGFVSTPLAGAAGPIKQLLRTSMITLVIAYVVNYAQYFTYLFALDAFLKYYLPIGVFLRCFTPTRKIGGSIIAVTAALVIVFPIVNTIAYAIIYSDDGPLVSFRTFAQNDISTYIGNVVGDLKNLLSPSSSGSLNIWSLIFNPLHIIYKFIQNFFGEMFFVAIAFATGVISRAFLIGVLMPLLNTFILVQSARGLSRAFGEEIDISSLTRLI